MTRAALFVAAVISLSASVVSADALDAVLKAEAERIAVMAQAAKPTLAIFAGAEGGGSGVVISPDGYALSNFHVTSPAGVAMKCGMTDGHLYDAVIVGLDPTGDVALIKLLGRDDFPFAPLGDSDLVQAGQWCFAMGNPFLLANDFQPTASFGLVSGVHRYQYPAGTLLEYADCIQTDAAINPGNSGGPLFNAQGELIGINGRGSFEKRGRVNVGVGYAISINQIKNFLGQLKGGRVVDHATLGAIVASDDGGRVVVTDIMEDSDAYRRGLRYDDEIVSFAGRPVTTVNAFKNALGIYPKGWRLPLTYRREGRKFDILVRLQGMHRAAELNAAVANGLPDDEGDKPSEPPADPSKPHAKPKTKKELPDEVKPYFEDRNGFANYYFNRQQAARVWKSNQKHGEFAQLTDPWTLAGRTNDDEPMTLVLGDTASRMELPIGDFSATAGPELASPPNPPGSGGMLAALHLWRRLLVYGPAKLGSLHYEGTAPLDDTVPLADVFAATDSGVECLFYFRADGHLAALEMVVDEATDPCEIRFLEYRQEAGRSVPSKLEVRYGDTVFGDFNLTELRTEASPESATPLDSVQEAVD